MTDHSAPLDVFHPVVSRWFGTRIGVPTVAQAAAWPRIAAGENVLVTAPTGSGKTLTAFLWSLNQLLTGAWPGGRVRVLYVSPLKALNVDIQRNLVKPLHELTEAFGDVQTAVQPVRVAVRSGDTPAAERQKMIRHSPEVLITTPESLNILLTSQGGRSILGDVTCLILDEIHAVAGSKRGTHLITAVERLGLLSGEFQRIALSATVRPVDRVARFIGGWRLEATPEAGEAVYRPRRVSIVRSSDAKSYKLRIESKLPGPVESSEPGKIPDAATEGQGTWDPLIDDLKARIRRNRSTLLFANSRRLTEKVTRLLNEDEKRDLAYSHHGSLSREIRSVVEQRLKEGRLAAIVATNTLELGIDIGVLDEVVLIRTPPSIASAIQRLGRSGHGVGETSRGAFYPLYDRDLLDAVVVASGVHEQDIEAVEPVQAPLDVLAQVVLSMVAAEPWQIDELYDFLRTAEPYHHLTRRQYDLVLEMLAGRYADSRIRELDPRLVIDRIDGNLRPRRGAARLIYSSGGTIPDRGYFHLRIQDSKAKLGELDEEFVWERSIGDTFSLGAQNWEITGITHNDVLVRPARRSSAMAPFWRAEERNRTFHLSNRLGEFLGRADAVLADEGADALRHQLAERHDLEAETASRLVALLEEQRSHTGTALPNRRHIVVERIGKKGETSTRQQVILHTFWGGRVNRPLAMALAVLWEEESGTPLQIEQDNDSLMLLLPEGVDLERLLRRVHPESLERLLRRRLESSGFFGARFRENAGRALLLPRGGFRRRIPLWFNRQRAKKLLTAVGRYEDFPVLAETWRTCLQDEFDLASLAMVLTELERGEIECSEIWSSTPSPLAADIVWKRTNRLMYEDDEPETAGASRLRRDLLQELVLGSHLRPRLPSVLIEDFQRKVRRTHPGYAPQQADELVEWVRERLVLPKNEWGQLLAAIRHDSGADTEQMEQLLEAAAQRLVKVTLPGQSDGESVVHLELLARLAEVLHADMKSLAVRPLADDLEVPRVELSAWLPPPDTDPLVELVAEWIRFSGPLHQEEIERALGLTPEQAGEALEALVDQERVVIDQFRDGMSQDAGLEICDAENLERLLRLLRAKSRPSFEARPISELPRFLASHQGVALPGDNPEDLMSCLERLFGWPAPARLWETEILPARLDPYYSDWLDALFHDTGLMWFGCGREQVAFCLQTDRDLLQVPVQAPDGEEIEATLRGIFPDHPGRFSLAELVRSSGTDSTSLSSQLWGLAWQGAVSNTTFRVVRQGSLNKFEPVKLQDELSSGRPHRGIARRGRFERWQATRPADGDWFALWPDHQELDALDVEELNKDRARIILGRYGILFRELLARELPHLKWSNLFRSLRLMELSGEVLSGHFFSGLLGPQFISPAAFKMLEQGLPADVVFWLNAADPASPCGLGLEDLGFEELGGLPARRPSSHLVYQGSRPVVVSQRYGEELTIAVDPDHPHIDEYLRFLGVMLTRPNAPKRAITVKTINGQPADQSPFRSVLARLFSVTREPGALKLRRRY